MNRRARSATAFRWEACSLDPTKRRIYAREGVGHLWLIGPERRMLEVFRLEAGRWLLVDAYEGDVPVRAEPFDAIELPLGRLWER
jgi:hypothetical protein